MAGFHEILFPVDISYESKGGPGYKTQIFELDSNVEHRVARQQGMRHRYNVAYGVKSPQQVDTLKRFHIARDGALNGFPFLDFSDFSTGAGSTDPPTSTDEVLQRVSDGQTGGDGVETQFQLVKRYVSGLITRIRVIEKPAPGTTVISIDDTPLAGGLWSVNTTNGLITFNTPPDIGTVPKGGTLFYTPVRFGEEADRLLAATIEDFSTRSIDDIPLVEISRTGPVDDEFYYGGAITHNTSTSISITQLQGRAHEIVPGADIDVFLPDMTGEPGGGPHFYVFHGGVSHTITFKKHGGGATGISLAAGAGVELVYNSLTDKWYGL